LPRPVQGNLPALVALSTHHNNFFQTPRGVNYSGAQQIAIKRVEKKEPRLLRTINELVFVNETGAVQRN
jgi:hypothetical protein